MAIYITLTPYQFAAELEDAGFGPMSYDLAHAFYDFLDEANSDDGLELDCIAIRSEFSLWSKETLIAEYGSEIDMELLADEGYYDEDEDSETPLVEDWLADQPMHVLLDLLTEYGSLDADDVVCYDEEQAITHYG